MPAISDILPADIDVIRQQAASVGSVVYIVHPVNDAGQATGPSEVVIGPTVPRVGEQVSRHGVSHVVIQVAHSLVHFDRRKDLSNATALVYVKVPQAKA